MLGCCSGVRQHHLRSMCSMMCFFICSLEQDTLDKDKRNIPFVQIHHMRYQQYFVAKKRKRRVQDVLKNKMEKEDNTHTKKKTVSCFVMREERGVESLQQ
jgi:hypothetical protein